MSKEYEKLHGGEGLSLTAAHEAGHIVLAWLSPAIETVDGTFWEKEVVNGKRASIVIVRHTDRTPPTGFTQWETMAIAAGGIAAEIITHQHFRTRNVGYDLNNMRVRAEFLCGSSGTMPVSPWPEPPTAKVPPFEYYFARSLAPAPAEVMRLCYLRARERILLHRGAYSRLRTALIASIEMTREEIAAALRIPKV